MTDERAQQLPAAAQAAEDDGLFVFSREEYEQQQTRSRRFTALDKALATLPNVGWATVDEPPSEAEAMLRVALRVVGAARIYEAYLRDG